jgi:hypothetical protein
VVVQSSPQRRSVGSIRRVVSERNRGAGILIVGSDASVEAAVVRGTEFYSNLLAAYGIGIVYDLGDRSVATVRSSVVEGNHDTGIFIAGSDATIEGTVVRDSAAAPGEPGDGWGIGVQQDTESEQRGIAVVRSSLVARARGVGVVSLGSDLDLQSTVVRDTGPRADGSDGWGVNVQASSDTGARSNGLLRGCLIERNHDVGVIVVGSDATIESTMVRHTQADVGDATSGMGMGIVDDEPGGARSNATVRTSVIEQNATMGVLVSGSDATIETTAVRDTRAEEASGRFGRGIQFQPGRYADQRSGGAVRWTTIERSFEVGIAVLGSDAAIEATLVHDVQPAVADGALGDGISIVIGMSTAQISGCRVEAAARAGVSSFGAGVSMAGTTIECVAIPLDAELLAGVSASFTDLGDNVCGCSGETEPCQVVSSMLSPPDALPASSAQ